MITVEKAKTLEVCRICEKPLIPLDKVDLRKGFPKDWMNNFGQMLYPLGIELNFGKECAHTKCLEEREDK